MIEKLEQRRASIEEETKALEDGLGRLDEWIDRQRVLEAEIQKLRKEIPHSFKDYITELHVPRIY